MGTATTRSKVGVLVSAAVFGAVLAGAVGSASGAVAPVLPLQSSDVVVELEPFVRIPATTRVAPRLNALAIAGDRVFVVEEFDGLIYEVVGSGDDRAPTLFFDMGDAIEQASDRELDTTNLFHGGLRGVAFHPDFERNGLFYTSHMESRPNNPQPTQYLSDAVTPIAADSVVAEWRYDATRDEVTAGSYRVVFRVGMPFYDHPIKQLAFNPFARSGDDDYGLLYVAHGDGSVLSAIVGGGRNNDALGKILRIDPRPSGGLGYTIPPTNPFVGDPSMHDAVWSLGHRNPHHLAFGRDDRGRVLLIVAEPGRDNVEEVNVIRAGSDYGWSAREGTFVHKPEGGGLIDGIEPLPADDWQNGYTYPAAQLGHTGEVGGGFGGQAIAGGFVVDNGSVLSGSYVVSDFPVTGELFVVDVDALASARTTLGSGDSPAVLTQASLHRASVRFDHDDDPATAAIDHNDVGSVIRSDANHDGSGRADVRFGQGPEGELYILNKRNGLVYLVTNSLPPDVRCHGRARTQIGRIGTPGPDVLIGSPGDDRIDGRGGNDVICGRGGNDRLYGGDGRDLLDGGTGRDRIYGGRQADHLIGGTNRDRLVGQSGADRIDGQAGPDVLRGNGGIDRIHGNGGDDDIDGGPGLDVISGGRGSDVCELPARGCERG